MFCELLPCPLRLAPALAVASSSSIAVEVVVSHERSIHVRDLCIPSLQLCDPVSELLILRLQLPISVF
jgi:hypothetical protein